MKTLAHLDNGYVGKGCRVRRASWRRQQHGEPGNVLEFTSPRGESVRQARQE